MCYKGIGSKRIANYLYDKGYKTVYSLQGGFKAWKEYENAQIVEKPSP